MKKLNIFYMGEKLCQVYPHATRWEVMKFKVRKWTKYTVRYSFGAGLMYSAFIAGSYLNPVITYAVQDKIIQVEGKAPVMDRIAKCESEGKHTGKSGQVLAVGNTNKSVDIGKYQINLSVWGAKATEMELNLFEEGDNEKFAMYLYKNFGTEPWVHSKHCWNK